MRTNKIIELLSKKFPGLAVRVDGDSVWIGQMRRTLQEARYLVKQ